MKKQITPEAIKIAHRLWDTYEGIRERIRDVLDLDPLEFPDDVPLYEEVIASVCVDYLMRIFGPGSPIGLDCKKTEIGENIWINDEIKWKLFSDAPYNYSFFDNASGLPKGTKGEGYGIALYVYCILKARNHETRLYSNTRKKEPRVVWNRLMSLGVVERAECARDGYSYARSVDLSFLPQDADAQLSTIAEEFNTP